MEPRGLACPPLGYLRKGACRWLLGAFGITGSRSMAFGGKRLAFRRCRVQYGK